MPEKGIHHPVGWQWGEEEKEGKARAERKKGGKEGRREGGRQGRKEGRKRGKEEGRKGRKERGRDFCTQEFMQPSWFFLPLLLKSEHKHKDLHTDTCPKIVEIKFIII